MSRAGLPYHITLIVPAVTNHATQEATGRINFPAVSDGANQRNRLLRLRAIRFKYYSDSRLHAVNWDGWPDRMVVRIEGLPSVAFANNGEVAETALGEGPTVPPQPQSAMHAEATNRELNIACIPCSMTGWESRVTGQMFGYAGYDMKVDIPVGWFAQLPSDWGVSVRMYDAEGLRQTVFPTTDFVWEW